MIGTVRGVSTLIAVGLAGLLIWISTQIGEGSTGGYWAVYGILAGAGLTISLSQVAGGWTKWGWPRMSIGVFLIGFLPALVAAGWVLLAKQPDANWFQRQITSWSGHAGIRGLVDDMGEYLGVLAFGLGLVFGLTFDTSGPLRAVEPAVPPEPVAEPTVAPARPRPMPDPAFTGTGQVRRERVRKEEPVR